MKIQAKKQVPAGSYNCEFLVIESSDHPEYGAGLCWSWEISDGRYRGEKIFRTTKVEATSKNSCGKFMVALTSKSLEAACEDDTDDYIGSRCSCIVGQSENGVSRVEHFAIFRDEDGADPADKIA